MDRIPIMLIVGGVDLWTYMLWVVDRISIMDVAGPVDLWTCRLRVVDCMLTEYPSWM